MARRGEQLAPTREHAPPTRCACPPESFVTGVPGSASAGSRPTRRSHSPIIAAVAAQRELEAAAHVEMIEQRPRCGTRPSWPRSRSSCAATTSKPASSSSSRSNSTRERRLASAGAEQHHDFAGADRQIDAIDQHAPVGKRDAQAADRQRFHAARTVADTVSPGGCQEKRRNRKQPRCPNLQTATHSTREASGEAHGATTEVCLHHEYRNRRSWRKAIEAATLLGDSVVDVKHCMDPKAARSRPHVDDARGRRRISTHGGDRVLHLGEQRGVQQGRARLLDASPAQAGHAYRPHLVSVAVDHPFGGLAIGFAAVALALMRMRDEKRSPYYRIGTTRVEQPVQGAPSGAFRSWRRRAVTSCSTSDRASAATCSMAARRCRCPS